MPKIVILGSCRFSPYDVLAVPSEISPVWNTEAGYEIAFRRFGPAIEKADIVIVYAPDGIGEFTNRDLAYAKSIGKRIHIIRGPKP